MSIEFCPRCSARVRVPVAADPDSWVRCPRCRVESQLSEILAAEPPLLELIDGPSGTVPSYEPALAGVAAEGEHVDDFNVTEGDTLVVDEDSPTLPLGGVSMEDSFFDDDEAAADGASIGRATAVRKEDDELFGFDDNPDVAALRTTTDDGKFMEVPSEEDEEFNLTPEAAADFGQPSANVPTMGAGFGAIPTTPPRRKKKSNMLVTMVGVIGGGMFGLLIAYYGILMWALGRDDFKLAKHVPEGMQMLLPEALQTKPPVNNTVPPPADPGSSLTGPMLPEDGTSIPDGTTPPENNPGVPGTPTDNTPTNPLDPLAMPDKPLTPADPLDPLDPLTGGNLPAPKTGLDPLDPLAGNLPPPKPSNDPNDPFGNPGTNPAMPKPEVTPPAPTDPLDPLATPTTPPQPEVPTPTVDPLDPLAVKPVDPLMPKPVDPLDPLAVKPVDPLDPLAPPPTDPLTPKPVDPLDPLAVKPVDPLDPLAPPPTDPLTPKPVDPLDPLAVKPVDPLTAAPADPLAAPAKPREPLMLAGASYAPEELQKSLLQVEAAVGALAPTPEDRKQQAAVYRALGHVGEVAGQLKSLGETEQSAQLNLDSLEALAKKLAADPLIPVLNNLTYFWQGMGLDKRNHGIILQGTPGQSEPIGKLHKASFEIANPDPTKPGVKVNVISEYPLLPGKDGKVTLLGVIVDNPTEQIPGYTGPAERVIWVSVAQLDKPATPAAETPPPAQPAPAKTPGDDPFGDIK